MSGWHKSHPFFCLNFHFLRFFPKFALHVCKKNIQTNNKPIMKKFSRIFLAVASLVAVAACTTDTTEDLGISINGAGSKLAISLEESRTQLGEKADGVYPLYWSEGDAVAVNGIASTALTAEQAGSASALFTFDETLTRPFNIVYPAPAEGVAAVTEGCYPVTFPATQTYTEGGFASGAAPMYGYAAEGTESAIQLNHLTGVLRIAVKGDKVLRYISVNSESSKIAGNFDVDCATGTLTAHEDASNNITMSFGEGLQLSADKASDIYITIPAGDHGVITITLNTTDPGEKMTVSFDSSAKPVKAGFVREFQEFTHSANSSVEYIIVTKEDLIRFAEDVTTFETYTTVRVAGQIDMTGEAWTPVAEFNYTFNGGKDEGYYIKGLSAPLFDVVNGHIKNLALVDVAIDETVTPNVGAIARQVIGATDAKTPSVVNCSATGTITVNCPNYEKVANGDQEFSVGGLIGYALNAGIEKCVNEVDVTVTQLVANTASYTIYGCTGGIVGYAQSKDFTGEAKISECENKGDITFSECSDAEGDANVALRVAGCVGVSSVGYSDIYKCVNRGVITVNNRHSTGYLGGVSGLVSACNIDNCENYGAINFNAQMESVLIGGVLGAPNDTIYFHLDNCHNYGAITTTAEASVAGFLCGGVTSKCTTDDPTGDATNYYVRNLTNNAPITISHTMPEGSTGRHAVGGIVAWAQSTLENCTNSAAATITLNGTIYANSNCAKTHNVGGIVGYKSAKPVTKSTNNAAMIINPTVTVNANILSPADATINAGYSVGGIVGYSTQGLANAGHSTEGASISVGGNIGTVLYVGGIAGFAGSISSAVNKCPVTITKDAKLKGLVMGGVGGRLEKLTDVTNEALVSYYGDTNMTGVGDGSVANGCAFFRIGGVAGMGGASKNVTNAKDATVTIAGKFTASYNKKYGFTAMGGVVGQLSGSHNGVFNYATVNFSSTIPNASWNEEPFVFGGCVGYLTTNVSNFINEGDINISCNSKSDEQLRLSGVFGRGSNTETHVYDNIINRGTITISAVSDDSIIFGAINAYGINSTYSNVINEGDVIVTEQAKTNTKMFIGGIFSSPSAKITTKSNIVNKGNITVKGAAGADGNISVGGIAAEGAAAITCGVNVGKITVVRPQDSTSTYHIGGIIGISTGSVSGVESYCDIEAIGLGDQNIGMIKGQPRVVATTEEDGSITNTVRAALNCKLGGRIAVATSSTEDADGNSVSVIDWNVISADNFYNYIYGGTTDWTGVDAYDGCSFLSVAPEV